MYVVTIYKLIQVILVNAWLHLMFHFIIKLVYSSRLFGSLFIQSSSLTALMKFESFTITSMEAETNVSITLTHHSIARFRFTLNMGEIANSIPSLHKLHVCSENASPMQYSSNICNSPL